MKTGSLGDDKMAFSRKPGALCQGGIFVIVFGPDRRLGRLSFAKRSEEPGVGLTPDNKRSSAGRRANPHFLQADPYFESANDPKAQDKQILPFQPCKLDFFVLVVVSQVAITNQTREPADRPPWYFVRFGTSAGNSNRRGTTSVYLLLNDYATTYQVERAEVASDELSLTRV